MHCRLYASMFLCIYAELTSCRHETFIDISDMHDLTWSIMHTYLNVYILLCIGDVYRCELCIDAFIPFMCAWCYASMRSCLSRAMHTWLYANMNLCIRGYLNSYMPILYIWSLRCIWPYAYMPAKLYPALVQLCINACMPICIHNVLNMFLYAYRITCINTLMLMRHSVYWQQCTFPLFVLMHQLYAYIALHEQVFTKR